jgi:hypothetical protein
MDAPRSADLVGNIVAGAAVRARARTVVVGRWVLRAGDCARRRICGLRGAVWGLLAYLPRTGLPRCRFADANSAMPCLSAWACKQHPRRRQGAAPGKIPVSRTISRRLWPWGPCGFVADRQPSAVPAAEVRGAGELTRQAVAGTMAGTRCESLAAIALCGSDLLFACPNGCRSSWNCRNPPLPAPLWNRWPRPPFARSLISAVLPAVGAAGMRPCAEVPC